MLHQATKLQVCRALKTNKTGEVALVLEAEYRRMVCLNNQRYSNVTMGLSLKLIGKSCLINTTLTLEEQQQAFNKPVIKS